MKKMYFVLALILLLTLTSAFALAAEPYRPMGQEAVPENVTESYLIPTQREDGLLEYKTDTFVATMEILEPDSDCAKEDSSDAIAMHSLQIPSDVTETYLEPIEVGDGIYEYRDTDGTLIATMYENPEDNPATFSARKSTKYTVDMDAEAGETVHGSENIDISTMVTINYDIDFARNTPSLLGQYVSANGHSNISWFSPGSANGFYRSINIVGSAPISVAIKNQGTQSNIYTGTVTVS